MSTALAVHPPSHSSPLRPRDTEANPNTGHLSSSPRSRPPMATNRSSHDEPRRSMSSNASNTARRARNNASRSPSIEESSNRRSKDASSISKTSPNVPVIKKEKPSSPDSTSVPTSHPASMPPSRHRPRKLDLSTNKAATGQGANTSRASASLTSKDSGNLSAMHDVGLACLSPGFQTHDPSRQQQLQRSMEMRDQQRQIIEARLHGKSTGGNDKPRIDAGPQTSTFAKAPMSSRRKGPPPGLHIAAPSAQHFAAEPRVVQSAPLNQTFTGLSKPPSSLSRQVLDHNSQRDAPGSSNGQAPQTANRLPPISDVFASEGLGSARGGEMGRRTSAFHAPHSQYSATHPSGQGPLPSPGFPGGPPASAGLHPPPRHPSSQHSHDASPSGRQREFRSAEEAMHTLAGGREDLLPKMVHYGSRAPPTPPSPREGHQQQYAPHQGASSRPQLSSRSGSGRRRTREEYERDFPEGDRMELDYRESRGYPSSAGRAPGGGAQSHSDEEGAQFRDTFERGRRFMPAPPGSASFGVGRDSPETNRRKKEEFMGLCARAWDLFHS